MLIEIGRDVVVLAAKGEERPLQVLRELALAFRRCYHVIFTDRRSLSQIQEIEGLSQDEKTIYQIIGGQLATYYHFYKSFTFHAYVTFASSTTLSKDVVLINPSEMVDFEWFSKTFLLTENLSDALFYEYLVHYYLRKVQVHGFKMIAEKVPGGGDTTVGFCEAKILERRNFCLTIVDSDMKYPGGNIGSTCSKVIECIGKYSPFNCQYYVINKLSEIENLIPLGVISSLPCYKQQQVIRDGMNICFAFFDFKKGLRTNEIMNSDFYNYWVHELKSYPSLAQEWDDYRQKALRCKDKKEYEEQKQGIIIEGFGEKLLAVVMGDDRIRAALWKVEDADLYKEQQQVWYEIGHTVFEWCCAFRSLKNK